MAGFADLEKVVRPVVVKDIRPSGIQAARAATDAVVTITGQSVQIVDLAHTVTSSASRQGQQEQERTFDLVKVMNENDPEQFVRAEIPTRLKLGLKGLPTQNIRYAPTPEADNIEVEKRNVVRPNPQYGQVVTP